MLTAKVRLVGSGKAQEEGLHGEKAIPIQLLILHHESEDSSELLHGALHYYRF